jgi:hypothetical protein
MDERVEGLIDRMVDECVVRIDSSVETEAWMGGWMDGRTDTWDRSICKLNQNEILTLILSSSIDSSATCFSLSWSRLSMPTCLYAGQYFVSTRCTQSLHVPINIDMRA